MDIGANHLGIAVGLRRELLELATSSNSAMFLAVLVDELTLSARGEYEVGRKDAVRGGAGLRPFNEMLRVVAAQLGRTAGTGARGYPNEALVDVLWENAVIGEIQQSVATALQRTVERVRRMPT